MAMSNTKRGIFYLMGAIVLVFTGVAGSTLLTNLTGPAVREQIKMLKELEQIKPLGKTSSQMRVKMFDCDTQEMAEVGFANLKEETPMVGNQEYFFTPGCALINLPDNVKVGDLAGVLYGVREVTPNKPDGIARQCGDIHGINKTPATCENFLNQHTSQRIRVYVENGGTLRIKIN